MKALFGAFPPSALLLLLSLTSSCIVFEKRGFHLSFLFIFLRAFPPKLPSPFSGQWSYVKKKVFLSLWFFPCLLRRWWVSPISFQFGPLLFLLIVFALLFFWLSHVFVSKVVKKAIVDFSWRRAQGLFTSFDSILSAVRLFWSIPKHDMSLFVRTLFNEHLCSSFRHCLISQI